MSTTPATCPTRPCKEQVRAWLLARRLTRQPLPDLADIRRDVGWTARPDVAADVATR